MRVTLAQVLQPSVRRGLRAAGFDIVRIGDVPWWFEPIESMRSEVYRKKALED